MTEPTPQTVHLRAAASQLRSVLDWMGTAADVLDRTAAEQARQDGHTGAQDATKATAAPADPDNGRGPHAGAQTFAALEDEHEALGTHVNQLEHERDQLRAERDGAYRERAQLLAWLAALLPEGDAVLTPAPDADDGWMLLFLHVRGQQLTWHIAPSDRGLFEDLPVVGPHDERARWDGHTTEDKYHRIAYLVEDLWSHCGRECIESHSYRGRCEALPRT